jgi:hypothetical protein
MQIFPFPVISLFFFVASIFIGAEEIRVPERNHPISSQAFEHFCSPALCQ